MVTRDRIGKRGALADYVLLAGRAKYVTESPAHTAPAPAFMDEAVEAPMVRAQVNRHAWDLARDVRKFICDADQFISVSRRYDLLAVAIELEALSDGR